jgi:hypothetical protein
MKKIISLSELKEVLLNVKGVTFAGLATSTIPKLPKSCPFLNVSKLTLSNVTIGAFYSNSVNRQRVREGNDATFEAQPRAWGTHIEGTPLVEHKEKFYLACQFNKAESSFLCNGKAIEKAELVAWLPKESDPKESQGVEKAIVYRTYALESIKELTMKGDIYIIV